MPEQPGLPEEEKRLFTLEEANELIPFLTQCIAEIQILRQAVLNVMESKSDASKGNGHIFDDLQQTEHDLLTVTRAAGRITELVEAVSQTGAEVKDIDAGLVDFPSIRSGRTVYLCWRLGEEKIRFWHDLSSGAAGRRPL